MPQAVRLIRIPLGKSFQTQILKIYYYSCRFVVALSKHFFLKESVTVFRVHAIVQLVMIAATPIPTNRGQLCLAIDKTFFYLDYTEDL